MAELWPKGPERNPERERKKTEVRDLLYPGGMWGIGAQYIKDVIYKGEEHYERREARTIEAGYDPGVLEILGTRLLNEWKKLDDKGSKRTPDETERYDVLNGFTHSMVENKEGDIISSRHSDLTVGLIAALSEAFRRSLKVSLIENPTEEDAIVKASHAPEVSDDEIEKFIDILAREDDATRAMYKRQEEVLMRNKDYLLSVGRSRIIILTGTLNMLSRV